MGGTEAERWGKLTQKEKDDALYKVRQARARSSPSPRRCARRLSTTTEPPTTTAWSSWVRPPTRQATTTTRCKNSWDVRPPYDRSLVCSRARSSLYKTTSVMVTQARPAQRDRQEAGHQITRAQRQQLRRSPCRQAAGSPKRKAA
ncbi:MAG: hypothetical protein ACLUQ6_07940 [Alistipes onderdonkii]